MKAKSLSYYKTRRLVYNNTNANVRFNWRQSPQAKFQPGDTVIVKDRKYKSTSQTLQRMAGRKGTVLAVSSYDNDTLTDSTSRHWTKYYITTTGNDVVGAFSWALNPA